MGIFDRVSRVFKSKANAAVDKLRDPAKEVGQLILEMEEQVRAAQAETVALRASEKLCAERVAELDKSAQTWGQRAEQAVRAGDDELARGALAKRQVTESELAQARRDLQETTAHAEKLQEALKSLQQRIRQYKLKQGTIKAKVTIGKKALTPGTTDSLDEFDRIAGKVEDAEVAIDAAQELASDQAKEAELAAKVDRLAKAPGDLDGRLAALKEKMSKE